MSGVPTVPVSVSAPLSDLTNTHNSHSNININTDIHPTKPVSLIQTPNQIPTMTTPELASTNKDANTDADTSHMTDQQTPAATVSATATAPAASSPTVANASSSSSSSSSVSVSDADADADIEDEASSAIRAEVSSASAGKSSDECIKLAEQYQKQGKNEHQIITLQQTLQKAVVEHGELALQCAPLYYKYGAALLEWYMKQSTQAVLGEAMRAREGGSSNGAAGSSTDEDLELAWENLDVARVIYAAQIDKMDKEAAAGTSASTSTSSSTSSDAAASPCPSRHDLCLGLASVLESIGDASMEMEQFPVAYLDYGRGLAILQSDPECPPYHRSRAVLHSQMAVVALYQQNLLRAQHHYQHAANVFATRVMYYATRIQQAKHEKYQIQEQIPPINMQSSVSSSSSKSESVSSSITSAPTELVYTSPLLQRIYAALGLKNTDSTTITTTPTTTTTSSSSTPTPSPLDPVEQAVEEIKECMEILEDLEERIVDLGEQAQNQAKVAASSGSLSLSSSTSSSSSSTAGIETDSKDGDAGFGFAAGASPSSNTDTSTNSAVAAAAPFAFLMANGYDPTTTSSSSSSTTSITTADAPTTLLVPKRKPKATPAPASALADTSSSVVATPAVKRKASPTTSSSSSSSSTSSSTSAALVSAPVSSSADGDAATKKQKVSE